jgi:hypothetical protein
MDEAKPLTIFTHQHPELFRRLARDRSVIEDLPLSLARSFWISIRLIFYRSQNCMKLGSSFIEAMPWWLLSSSVTPHRCADVLFRHICMIAILLEVFS